MKYYKGKSYKEFYMVDGNDFKLYDIVTASWRHTVFFESWYSFYNRRKQYLIEITEEELFLEMV